MNAGLPWSEEFSQKHQDRWVWKALSLNKTFPWSEDFFQRHADKKWDWGGLSANEGLPWTEEFYHRYRDRWYRDDLMWNASFPKIFLDPLLTDNILCEILDP
jgi:hypothetical protein